MWGEQQGVWGVVFMHVEDMIQIIHPGTAIFSFFSLVI